MEHTFKIEKELKITTENIVDCVLSCEAGGFDYWGELCSDEKDYEAARQRLAEREKADMKPCYEDVLAEILESGGKLTVYDREHDKDHELTLEKLLNGWKLIKTGRPGGRPVIFLPVRLAGLKNRL